MDRVKKTHAKLKKTAKEMASVAREEFAGHEHGTDSVKHQWLYVLKLQDGRWFVGTTSRDVERVYKQHLRGTFGNWTRRYKPIKIQNAQYLGSISDAKVQLIEGRMIRKYMEHYGDENVRGGDATGASNSHRTIDFVKSKKWFIAPVPLVVILFMLVSAIMPEPASTKRSYEATTTPTPTVSTSPVIQTQPAIMPTPEPSSCPTDTPTPTPYYGPINPSASPTPTPEPDYSSSTTITC